MELEVALDVGRTACSDSVRTFVEAASGLDEYELLGASRCHGWTRLDVVAHVIGGWQEMLGGLVSPMDEPPTVDAASYWTAFADEYGGADQVLTLMSQRRRTAAYARPAAAIEQLTDVADALLRGVAAFPARACFWQGHVFAPGNYLSIWTVENVVHQLDLRTTRPPRSSGLMLARATIEILLGEPLPRAWTDEQATLIGAGRVPAPTELGALADRLPVLG